MSANTDELMFDYQDMGFRAGWMGDLQVGDLFVVKPMFTFDTERPSQGIHVATRVQHVGRGVNGPGHFVVQVICENDIGREIHMAYGKDWDIYLYRPAS